MQYFNIQMASQLSGVASATIRAWEKRYQAVTPHRADNKHRLYSEKDIEKLSLLAKITDYGQNIGKIARLELEELRTIYSTLINRPYEIDLISSPKERVSFEKTLTNLTLAISSFKMDIISHELKKVRQNASTRDIVLKLLFPLYQMMEQKLKNQEITEGHRLALDHVIFFELSSLLADKELPLADKTPLIISSPNNDPLSLEIFSASLLCAHYRRNFLYLGPSIKPKVLSEAASDLKSEAILLSSHDYHLGHDASLDNFLDEFIRSMRHNGVRIFIIGPPAVEQSTTRKNCIFIHNLLELDQKLAGEKM